jgi:hypothetical protein
MGELLRVFARAVPDIAMKITRHRENYFMESRDAAIAYLRALIAREPVGASG